MSDYGHGLLERPTELAQLESDSLDAFLDGSPLLAEHCSRRGISGASLIVEILNLLSGATIASDSESLREPLSDGEMRVLRYLPSGLTTPEIACELYLSVNTVKTHLRHVYAKLGVHRRVTAVERARALGLLHGSSLRTDHSPARVQIASRVG